MILFFNLLIDVLIIIFLFVLFGISHTILASNKIKQRIVEGAGNKIAYYRLFYNFISLISFLIIYEISPKPDVVIYDLNYPWDIIILVPQVLSLFGLIWSVKHVDLKEFLGISQIKRYLKNEYKINELDEHSELIIKGAYKYSRHPIYFFSILFLGFRPVMDVFYLTFFFCLIVYFIIGSVYEEKKLVEKFGAEYLEYQKRVPALIPYKIFNK
ncbi:MAG: isoprenylcysteine carboxylmethyltransferase family protein [Melioribacteraceae bacterium]|nr:MAG: isoprenylcysteine carboxylmethyltransferase family protein [Melioribacteraceae bacterium]